MKNIFLIIFTITSLAAFAQPANISTRNRQSLDSNTILAPGYAKININTDNIAANTAAIALKADTFAQKFTGPTTNFDGYMPRTFANYFPTENTVTTINNSKYNFTGLMDYFPDGTYVHIVREGTSHVGAGDFGILRMRTSTNQGQTWSSPTTIYSNGSYDARCQGGGVTPSGRLVVFFGRYNPTTAAWFDQGYIYSDDKGVTWSSYTTISVASNPTFAPYGAMVSCADNTLIQGWYGVNGSTWTQYIVKSTDNGATWGSPITVITSAVSHYCEGSFVYLSGSSVLGILRNDNGTGFRQVYSSDNGDTWSDVGTTTFEVTTSGNCRQGVFGKYLTASGKQAVVFYYVNQPGGKLRSTTAFATDAIAGLTGWGTPVDLATLDVSIFALGYPAFIHPFGQAEGFGTFCDQTSSSVANIRFITTPAKPLINGLDLLAGTMTDLISPVKVTATMPTTITGTNTAIDVQVTSAGSSSFLQRLANFNFAAGYTGSNLTIAASFTNSLAGTGTGIISGNRNAALSNSTIGTTNGTNVANVNDAANGLINVASVNRSITAKNSGKNIGALNIALNTGTSPVMVGSWNGLGNADPTIATSAAIIADNGSQALPIMLLKDNGTTTITVADGGAMRIGDATSPTDKLEVTGNIALTTAGNKLKITEGSNGSLGQTTLVSGTKAITISGLSTSSRAIVTFVSVGGTVTTTWQYKAVCTTNTLTITAIDNTGATNTNDTSVLNYLIIN